MGEILQVKSIKHKQYWEHCPWCGHKVIVIDSRSIYGKGYGLLAECSVCKARTKINSQFKGGLLATQKMSQKRMECHFLFDRVWKNRLVERNKLYRILADKLGITRQECHFSYFNLEDLNRAYQIIKCNKWWE